MTADDAPGPGGATPTTSGDRQAALDRSLTRGVAWMGSIRWVAQLVTWASTLVVVRLLTPADYGLVGLATIYLGIVTMVSEFGIGLAIVTLRDLDDTQRAQINGLSVAFGIAGFLLSFAAAPLLAWFFAVPALRDVVIAMATIFIISGVRTVPQAVLQRDMRFRDLALNDGLQAVALAVGSVVFALLGFRYWTLVLSAILGALLSTLGVLRLVRIPVARPRWRTISAAIVFSRQTLVARLAWYAYTSADFIVAQKVLGEALQGAYRVAWDLTSTPLEKITTMVGRVTPSILSAAQDDHAALRRYLLRITETLALVTFPATIGMALVAGDLVPLLLGSRWSSMIVPLQLLGVAAAIRSVAPILPQVLVVTGANALMMRVNVVGAVVMPLAFVVGSRWGTAGIATAWLTVYPLLVLGPMAFHTFRQVQLPAGEYLRALRPATTGVLVMCAAVMGLRSLYPATLPRAAALAVDIGMGALAYGGALLLLHRARIGSILSRLRGSLT